MTRAYVLAAVALALAVCGWFSWSWYGKYRSKDRPMRAMTGGPTHVVADALNTFTFDRLAPFGPVTAELNRIFGISPTDINDLVNVWSGRRPDLAYWDDRRG